MHGQQNVKTCDAIKHVSLVASKPIPADLMAASQGRSRHGDVRYILYFLKNQKITLSKTQQNRSQNALHISEVFLVTPHMKCVL